ncbi:hypothetical protein LCGC14_1095580 [marine sediment metagenome]|uniref:Uncharacterized protein n=1 Tax=marine sediment metagenome TaxID=412755 RepID=A0A0F9QH12_9ZZZZ
MKKYLFIILVALGAACMSSEDPEPTKLIGFDDWVPPPDTTWFLTDTTKLGDQFNIMLVDFLGYADSVYYDPGPYDLDSVYRIDVNNFQGRITDDQGVYLRILSINWTDSTWKGMSWNAKIYTPVVLDSGFLSIKK